MLHSPTPLCGITLGVVVIYEAIIFTCMSYDQIDYFWKYIKDHFHCVYYIKDQNGNNFHAIRTIAVVFMH